jgi:hypothetical protein
VVWSAINIDKLVIKFNFLMRETSGATAENALKGNPSSGSKRRQASQVESIAKEICDGGNASVLLLRFSPGQQSHRSQATLRFLQNDRVPPMQRNCTLLTCTSTSSRLPLHGGYVIRFLRKTTPLFLPRCRKHVGVAELEPTGLGEVEKFSHQSCTERILNHTYLLHNLYMTPKAVQKSSA